MGQTIAYRKQLLLAVEAFLEATPDSMERGHQIIRTYLHEISREEMYLTLDWFLFPSFLLFSGLFAAHWRTTNKSSVPTTLFSTTAMMECVGDS